MKEKDTKREKILRKNGFRPLDEVSGKGATDRFVKIVRRI